MSDSGDATDVGRVGEANEPSGEVGPDASEPAWTWSTSEAQSAWPGPTGGAKRTETTAAAGVLGRGGAETPRGRGWLLVAVVAALIGAGVGAGVTALTEHTNASAPIATIKEGTSAPGAALEGGVSIPKLVTELLPAVVSIDVKTATQEDQGTGMIISPNGFVVTNYHVIALAAEYGGSLSVTESGSTSPIKATLVGTDQADDVALLRIDGASNLKTVVFGNSDKAVVGDAVVAIGNALGLSQGSPTVTQGIVSAIGRTVTASDGQGGTETLSNLIQTDAAINPGNSGGPLIDTAGQVIAMNTAVAGTTSNGSNAQNIGFAIPSAQIESLLPTLEKGGANPANSPGRMGVSVTTLTPQLRAEYGFTPTSGAIVTETVPGGPADQAGLTQDDVIVAIDAKPVTSASDLQAAVQAHRAGQRVSVTFYRGSRRATTSVTLITETELQNLENQAAQNPFNPFGGFGG